MKVYTEPLHFCKNFSFLYVYFYNPESKYILIEYVPLQKSQLFTKVYINCI